MPTMSATAATHALRRCLRSKSTLAACMQNAASRQTCIASSVCPARSLTSTSSLPPAYAAPNPAQTLQSSRSIPHTQALATRTRRYSSSIQGTIGKGEQGIEDEASATLDALAAPEHLNEKEKEIWGMLQKELKPVKLEVQDISGGCGSMYGIEVVSERFRGLSMLKQQRLVNQVLGEEIRGWHGVQLRTSVP